MPKDERMQMHEIIARDHPSLVGAYDEAKTTQNLRQMQEQHQGQSKTKSLSR